MTRQANWLRTVARRDGRAPTELQMRAKPI
jgi:hypothetical protein